MQPPPPITLGKQLSPTQEWGIYCDANWCFTRCTVYFDAISQHLTQIRAVQGIWKQGGHFTMHKSTVNVIVIQKRKNILMWKFKAQFLVFCCIINEFTEISILGTYTKEMVSTCWKEICSPLFFTAVIYNSQEMECAHQ